MRQNNKAQALGLLSAVVGDPVVTKNDGNEEIGKAEGTVSGLGFKVSWRPSTWADTALAWLTVEGKRVAQGERVTRVSHDDLRRAVSNGKYLREQRETNARRAVIETSLKAAMERVHEVVRRDLALLAHFDLVYDAVDFALSNGYLRAADEAQAKKVPS